ncbi:DUF5339 domain-containing protein [uncultured Actinobacillus sp.]|uniref:DUF5339 domain-containing protein n=1 Tax=uncultured Actinobacillus sp. TaxID=417616 RepID=UPI0025D84044|nr:DUF5339 domain-containing protein [uncultured Actinobacillus sp.]
MLKKFFITLLPVSFIILFSLNVNATVKTSSLNIGKTPTIKLTEQCKKMFSVADTLIREAEQQPGTHTQVAKLKSKLSTTKQQIAKMESDLQQKSCDKGLSALNTLKQKH